MRTFMIVTLIAGLTAAAASAGSYGKTKGADIVQVAVSAGNFTTLATALQAAGLVDALKGEGPFTVFAPTDEAFAKLPPGTVEALLKDIPRLKEILLYHVVPGKVTAQQVASLRTATTLQGGNVTVNSSGGGVTINNAKVVATDVMASNGVIHVIDTVILPPAR